MFVINETIVDIALLYCIVPLCFGVFILYNLLDMFKQFEAIPDLLLQFWTSLFIHQLEDLNGIC